MLKFFAGIIIGIYIAQEYGDQIPNVKIAFRRLLRLADEKLKENEKNAEKNNHNK
jgi:hypothetical protein